MASPKTTPIPYRYGFTSASWMAAKTEVRGILVECAKRRSFITYSQLVPLITAIEVEFRGPCLDALLTEISIAEEQHGQACWRFWSFTRSKTGGPAKVFMNWPYSQGTTCPK